MKSLLYIFLFSLLVSCQSRSSLGTVDEVMHGLEERMPNRENLDYADAVSFKDDIGGFRMLLFLNEDGTVRESSLLLVFMHQENRVEEMKTIISQYLQNILGISSEEAISKAETVFERISEVQNFGTSTLNPYLIEEEQGSDTVYGTLKEGAAVQIKAKYQE